MGSLSTAPLRLLLVLVTAVTYGCGRDVVATPDAGEPPAPPPATRDAGTQPPDPPVFFPDAGVPQPDGGFSLPPEVIPVEVHSMEPNVGPASGGTAITITGRGFLPDTTVTIGGAPLAQMVIYDERRIEGRTPRGSAGVAPVLIVNRAARLEVPGGFSYEQAVQIGTVTPGFGPASGGTAITVEGAGFSSDTVVLVGDRPAFDVRVVSPSLLKAVTPPGTAGLASLSVVTRRDSTTRTGAFRYDPDLILHRIEPSAGPMAGGNLVRLLGDGFDASTEVFFGAVPIGAPTVVSAGELQLVAPASAVAGVVDVVVRSGGTSFRLPAGYGYYASGAELSVAGIQPTSGSTAGGTEVTIVGSGFDQVQEVRFGGNAGSGLTVESANVLRVVTPAGSAGPVDVGVITAAGTASLTNGYRFEAPLAVHQVTPATGPVAGGTRVTLDGSGFEPGAEVFFGPVAAASVQWLSETTLQATTAPGAAGPVDVIVRQGARAARVPNAFAYVDSPELFNVSPSRGAIAGGTFVTITGAGFVPGANVYIGGTPAIGVRVLSSSIITARTPKGRVGSADVVATVPGGVAALGRGYLYFDPIKVSGGTSGPPVSGAVNVTVLRSYPRARLAGAFVTLGTGGDSAYKGITDANGQITFSGPLLRGVQTVTVGKERYNRVSVVGFDAENVTLFLNRLLSTSDSPPVGNPPPTPPPTPVLRGTIYSAFKGIPPAPEGFFQAVLVTTTATSNSGARYMSPANTLILTDDGREDRPYEIFGRYGDQAVYALAGHLSNSRTEFIPYVMGLYRYIHVLQENPVREGLDFEIATVLNSKVDIKLLNAPALSPIGPTVYRMSAVLRLGVDGVVSFFQRPESTGEPRLILSGVPPISGLLAGSQYVVTAGAYTLSGPYETNPMSEVYREQIRDISEPIELGPMMDLARPVNPLEGGTLRGDQRFVWRLQAPPQPGYFLIYLPMNLGPWSGALWEIVVPGNLRELMVPDLTALAGLPSLPEGSTFTWYVIAGQNDAFNIHNYDYSDFWPRDVYSMTRNYFVTDIPIDPAP